MNKKLSDWASVAEIISGIAVVITLVFLIVGIRDNTAALRGSAYADFLDSLNQLQASLMADPGLASRWEAYIRGDTSGLDQPSRAQLNLAVLSQIRIYEAAYFQREYELIGDREWDRILEVGCRAFRRSQPFLDTPSVFSEAFVTYMVDACPD